MNKNETILKTLRFDEFKKNENITSESLFKSFRRNSSEYEDEVRSIDDLGEGDEADTTPEDKPETVETKDINDDALDTGDSNIKGQDAINNLNQIINKIKKNEMNLTDIKNIYNDTVSILSKYPEV